MINTQKLQQQVLDDFAFHLGYDRDHSKGGYKRDLFHTCHSPFRRLNYNTMVLLYNRISQVNSINKGSVHLLGLVERHFAKGMWSILIKSSQCDTPIETLYLQYAKKKRTILCHKHQIKFSSCEAGQMMKEDFEKEVYPNG